MNELDKLEAIIEKKLNNYFSQEEALNEIKRTFPDIAFFPPSRGWAGSPDFLLKLVELVVTESPEYVIEFGSGVSSVILGAAMRKFSRGKVESFDHDENYSKKTNRFIEVNNLQDIVSINFSPLMDYRFDENNWKWYDKNRIDQIETGIDLLVVDGPPRFLQEKSRFLALPMLYEKLSTKSVVILDDANRDNEKQVVNDWIEFLKTKNVQCTFSSFEYFEKGLVVIEVNKQVAHS